ncbi:hypothetical protein QQ045_007967 [Rhodiola kirilowii]
MNSWLLKDISDEEVKAAVFSLGPFKSSGKDDPNKANSLKSILRQHERVSGQMSNSEKLKFVSVRIHRYLRLPLLVGQGKSKSFRDIVDKIWRKVKDWKCEFLYARGREVLVKAVIQRIPTYMMSVYYLPRKVISEIYELMQQFWWDNNEGGRGISWIRQAIL